MKPLLVTFLLTASVHASVVPKPMDPDDFFDNIGRRAPTREDLNNGKLTSSLGSGNEGVRAVIIQTDGRILMVGRTQNTTESDFALVRVNPDGALDPGFNATGKLKASFGSTDEWAHAAFLQTDGKIVAVGKVEIIGQYDFGAARFNSNGSFDTSFNTTGKKTIAVSASADIARGAAADQYGRIVLAGYSWTGTVFDSAMVRLATDGSLDTSFATTGKVTLPLVASDNAIMSVDVTSTNQIVYAGTVFNGGDWDAIYGRIRTNGTLDTAFRTSGKIQHSFGTGSDTANYIKYEQPPHDSFTVVGSSSNGTDLDFTVVRLDGTGDWDSDFNSSNDAGRLSFPIGSGDESASAVAILSDRSLIAAGYSDNGSKDNFAMAKVSMFGELDTSFNTNGKSSLSVGSQQDRIQAMNLFNDGNIVVGGRTWNGTNFDFSIIRLNGDGTEKKSGDPDQEFGK